MNRIKYYNHNNANKELIGKGHRRGVGENAAVMIDGTWWLTTPEACRRCTLREVLEWIKENV